MNFAYFRKSKFSKEETINNLKEKAQLDGLTMLGEIEMPKTNGILIQICGKDWMDKILSKEKDLLGLMPCGVLVLEKDGIVMAGSGDMTVLGSVTGDPEIQTFAVEAENKIRKLINESTGAGELRPINLKVYSTETCPYCQMEKDWLQKNNIKHEVIYVDRNQEEAEKLVMKTGQMGVPVTEIVYEDADPEFVIGFNKPLLEKVLKVV